MKKYKVVYSKKQNEWQIKKGRKLVGWGFETEEQAKRQIKIFRKLRNK
jgi:hypothetical protein